MNLSRTGNEQYGNRNQSKIEAAHEMIRRGEIDVEEVRQRLLKDYDDAEIQAIINLYAQAYGDSGLTAEEVLEEILCDSIGKMNAFATESTRSLAGEVGVFLRNVRKNVRRQEGGQKKNATGDGGVKKQGREIRNYSRAFQEQIEDYKNGKIKNGDTLIVGPTPEVFQKIGMTQLPVTINTTHIDYALNGTKDFDHYVGENLLKQLPEAIKHPIAIMTSATKQGSSVVVMLDIRHNGKQVIVPIVVDGFGYQNGIQIDSNAITSMYGKKYSISRVLYNAIDEESKGSFRLYYLDSKKATALLQVAKVPMPKMPATHDGGFIHSLSEQRSPVKGKFGSVTESQQFKRWFGDWQNNPATASKVVNDDGTPKVVYLSLIHI